MAFLEAIPGVIEQQRIAEALAANEAADERDEQRERLSAVNHEMEQNQQLAKMLAGRVHDLVQVVGVASEGYRDESLSSGVHMTNTLVVRSEEFSVPDTGLITVAEVKFGVTMERPKGFFARRVPVVGQPFAAGLEFWAQDTPTFLTPDHKLRVGARHTDGYGWSPALGVPAVLRQDALNQFEGTLSEIERKIGVTATNPGLEA